MIYAKRKDENQNALIEEFERAMPDATIFDASGAGRGFPDVVVGWRGRNFLFEIKNPDKPKSDQELTDAQKDLHTRWQGQIKTVRSAAEMCAEIARVWHNEGRFS